MPELPEVETIAMQLNKVLKGRVVRGAKVLRQKSFKGKVGELVGKKIKKVWRRSKIVVVEFVDWDKVVLAHLKMTGQLVFDEKKQGSNSKKQTSRRVAGGHPTADWVNKLPSKHTRVILSFKDGSRLFFNDIRGFGWMKIQEATDFKLQISSWPPDVVDEDFNFNYLKRILGGSKRAVKLVLLDQKKMGGLGNIYANDALFLARIDPKKTANDLDEKEVKRLWKAVKKVVSKGIFLGGATYSNYRDTRGLGGKYQEYFLVYRRDGEKCKKCGSEIEKFRLGGRGTYWCRECQKPMNLKIG